jgi:hypothetical protein
MVSRSLIAVPTEEKFTVVKDTREQQGWNFHVGKACAGMEVGTLKTGDYSLRGLETLLTIERKGSVEEFAGNVTQARFERELERMRDYPHAFLVLEFTMDDLLRFPYGGNIPHSKLPYIRVKGPFLMRRLMEIQVNYPVKVILAGKHGQDVAHQIFRRVLDVHQRPGSNQAAD